MQEKKYKGEGCEEGYKFLWMGEKDKSGVVGILEKEIMEVKRITTRIIKIKLVLEENLIHVISVYAPQGGKTQEEKEEFWEHWQYS